MVAASAFAQDIQNQDRDGAALSGADESGSEELTAEPVSADALVPEQIRTYLPEYHLFSSAIQTSAAVASPEDLPLPVPYAADASPSGGAGPEPTTPAPLSTASPVERLRVQIFPHIWSFTTPQGRERNIQEVTLKSEGDCRLWRAGPNPGTGPIIPAAGATDAAKDAKTADSKDAKTADSKDAKTADTKDAKPAAPSRPGVLSTGKRFHFSASELNEPRWLECDQPVTVVRSGARDFTYSGGFHLSRQKTSSGRSYARVVNVLSMEEYLRGVVTSEMLPSWPLEALKVQAVAARTYAYYQIFNPPPAIRGLNIDMDDTVLFQAYLGKTRWNAKADQAIAATAHQVLGYGNEVAFTHFSADSGGHTEDAKVAFNRDLPYERGRPEVYDPKLVGNKDWSVRLSPETIRRRLVHAGLIPSGGSLSKIEVLDEQRDPSGRAKAVDVTLSTGAHRSVPGTNFQFAVHLRSTMFTLTPNVSHRSVTVGRGKKKHSEDRTSTTYTLAGKGFGHGVGMSQWGSKALSEGMTWDFARMLAFYYSGSDHCLLQALPERTAGTHVAQGLTSCYAIGDGKANLTQEEYQRQARTLPGSFWPQLSVLPPQ